MAAKGEEEHLPEDDEAPAERQPARRPRASGARQALAGWLRGRSVFVAILAVLGAGLGVLLLLTDFHPTRIIAWVTGPEGAIYVSSPGVYTRERLVNDRNDQDYWLRQQMKELDRSEFRYSARLRSERRFASGNTDDAEASPKLRQVAPDTDTEPEVQPDPTDEANVDAAADKAPPADSPTLSFIDTFALRSAARDTLRQAVLENLLDDRHDLTGNSVYGLKFDTSIFPGQFTAGRAFVRLSITIDEADVIQRSRTDDKDASGLPAHVTSYYRLGYADLVKNTDNPFYSSKRLYDQWLDNVRWRLNTHFQQIAEKRCACQDAVCQQAPLGWRGDLELTINSVLAMEGATIPTLPPELTAGAGDNVPIVGLNVFLPDPWHRILRIAVFGADSRGCRRLPTFAVDAVTDSFLILPSGTEHPPYRALIDISDKESAYGFMPTGGDEQLKDALYAPHYRNLPTIVEFLTKEGKLAPCNEKTAAVPCERYLEIPAGYFNFIEKVIEPDMYAYSIFPRFDGSSVLLERSNAVALGQKKAGDDDGWLGFGASDDEQIASVVPGFIGFTDSDSDRRINFGWIIDLTDPGHAFQKSQFALISVPAWTSRLTVNVQSGWLNTRTGALDPDKDYQFRVPLPPDFEAFDAFIGGKEAVRRPKISNELMEKPVFSRCKRNAILIPGFRLWRSAMVTVGSEMADRIVVLPNMRGIIAEFPPSEASLRGSTSHVVRVWTSEGMDSIRDAVSYADDADSCSKPEDNPAGKLKVSDSSGIPPQTPVVEGSDGQ